MIRKKEWFFWVLRESTQKGNTAEIYNNLAKSERYETVILYPHRVKYLEYALSLVSNKYQNVLDIACGTGAFIDALPNKKKLNVIGFDISAGMLVVAKKRFRKYKNIIFKQQDVFDAKYPKESFDLITMAHATRFIPRNREKEFSKTVASWLTKDGTFIAIITWSPLSYIFPLQRLTGFPRGYNLLMQDPNYFVKAIGQHFFLEKEVLIKNDYNLFRCKAIYLKKK